MKHLILTLLLACTLFACSNKSGGTAAGGANTGNNTFGPGKQKGEDKNNTNPADNTGTNAETCLLLGGKLCAEFTGPQWNSELIHKVCAEHEGNISQIECKTANVVAECVLNKGLETEALVKYYLPVTRENAALDCNQANGILR